MIAVFMNELHCPKTTRLFEKKICRYCFKTGIMRHACKKQLLQDTNIRLGKHVFLENEKEDVSYLARIFSLFRFCS